MSQTIYGDTRDGEEEVFGVYTATCECTKSSCDFLHIPVLAEDQDSLDLCVAQIYANQHVGEIPTGAHILERRKDYVLVSVVG